jgi:predicted short-subunit dehydrogenase-like oxidoreductase (DUF2520 family)
VTAPPRVFVLGAGRAGRGLSRALRASGVAVVGVHGRRLPGGEDGVTVGTIPTTLADAEVALVTVRDEQLDAALAELRAAPLASGAVVLHASGSAEPGFDALRADGHPCGTFHPLLPLADPARAPALLRGAWIGIDGDEGARAAAHALAAAMGARTLEIPPGTKARYHAAAVFASNFPVALLSLATRLLESCGIDAAAADGAARSLFFAAVENLRHEGAAAALTGPVARGDAATVRRHRAALAGDAELLAAYDALSRAALRLAAERGLDAARLDEVRRALEGD